MLKKYAPFFFLTFVPYYSMCFANDPNQKALELALKAKHPAKVQGYLVEMVRKMPASKEGPITEKLLADTLSLLEAKDSPKFEFRVAHDRNEKDIIKKLWKALPEEKNDKKSFVAAEWADSKKSQIFPSWKPMPLLAATGSAWNGHHVYPGGLVYHLYTTAQTNLKLLQTYEKAFHYKFSEADKNLVVLSGIWHDAAKIFTMNWNEDGTLTAKEGKIAWAGSHHVISAAEALYRGHSQELVMAIAASHDAAIESEDTFQNVLEYLVATSIVAGKELKDVGVTVEKNEYVLLKKPSIFMIIQNLGDGDWVLTRQAMNSIREVLNEKVVEWKLVKKDSESEKNWLVNRILSTHGEVAPYHIWQQQGDKALKKFVMAEIKHF